jgi:quercetin 2,3-dioxygenase
MQSYILKANNRGAANYGWLQDRYYFSFANYYHPQHVQFGALRVMNDDSIDGGRGFDTHPHDNMEIITIVHEGALAHRDSMGNHAVIYPGEVQVMSAGTGVEHSEYNYLPDKPTKLFQIWIFPEKRNVTPRYDQKKFDAAERHNQWQKAVGPDTENGSIMIHQQAWIHLGDFDAGQTITYTSANKTNGLFIVVIEGNIETPLGAASTRDALGWYEPSVSLKATSATKLILLDVPLKWQQVSFATPINFSTLGYTCAFFLHFRFYALRFC